MKDIYRCKTEELRTAEALQKIFRLSHKVYPQELIGKKCVIRVPDRVIKPFDERAVVTVNHYVKIVTVSSRFVRHPVEEESPNQVTWVFEILIIFSLGVRGIFSHVGPTKEEVSVSFEKLPKLALHYGNDPEKEGVIELLESV